MKKERFVSLRIKMILGVIIICLCIGAVAVLSVREIAETIIDKEYKDKAEQISHAVAVTLDPEDVYELKDAVYEVYDKNVDNVVTSSDWGSDAWNEYTAKYAHIEELPVFKKLRDQMRVYQDIFNVDCIYITTYEIDVKHALYLCDGAYEDDCPPGCVDSFEDGIWPEKNSKVVHAFITNEDMYGWLVTGGYAVMKGDTVEAYVCVDISMNDVKAKERSYVITIFGVIALLTIVMIIMALWFAEKNIISPVIVLSNTAKNYCNENNEVIHHDFEKLSINSHDEISQLLSSMKQMEQDMNANINTLIDTKGTLKETVDKAEKLSELAKKDALTGIRNKTAYDYEVETLTKDLNDGFVEFGLAMVDLNFLKRTNDTYGHEKGNIAIRRLCNLVCDIFEHSPVFRIGGDEFIVILRHHDYRYIDDLIADFYEKIDEYENDDRLNEWEKISAAIGYAKFDRDTDKTVDDVFKKADKAMYEKKVSMKAVRKD